MKLENKGHLWIGNDSHNKTVKMAEENHWYAVKPVLAATQKKTKNRDFKTENGLMQVKSIAECSKRAFCNSFDMH